MKKNWITILMVLTIIVLVINLMTLNGRVKQITQEVIENLKNDSIVIKELSNSLELTYKNNNFEVNKFMKLINEKGDTVLLEEIDFDEHLFVIRFSEFHCMSCVTKEMEVISNFLDSNKNVICLASYSNLNDLMKIKRVMNISLPVYNIPFLVFDNELEQKKLPYYFVLDKNYRANNLFVATHSNVKLTSKYLQYISFKLHKE